MAHPRRWPPWWAYVAVAIGVNVVRQLLFPPDEVGTFWTVGLFVAVLALTAVVVTAGHHLSRRIRQGRP